MRSKAKVGTGMRNDSPKREAGILRARRRMRKEMDRAWKGFFEKNPDVNEEGVRRWIVERSRRKRNR